MNNFQEIQKYYTKETFYISTYEERKKLSGVTKKKKKDGTKIIFSKTLLVFLHKNF